MSSNCTDKMSQLLHDMSSVDIDDYEDSEAEPTTINSVSSVIPRQDDISEMISDSDIFAPASSVSTPAPVFICLKPNRLPLNFDPLGSAQLYTNLMLPCASMPTSAVEIVAALPSCELATEASWETGGGGNGSRSSVSEATTNANVSALSPSRMSSSCSSSSCSTTYATPPETLSVPSAHSASAFASAPEVKRRKLDDPVAIAAVVVVSDDPDLRRTRLEGLRLRLLEHPLLADCGHAVGDARTFRLSESLRTTFEADLAAWNP